MTEKKGIGVNLSHLHFHSCSGRGEAKGRERGATAGLGLIHAGDGARGRAAMALIKVSALKPLVQSHQHSQGRQTSWGRQAVICKEWPRMEVAPMGTPSKGLLGVGC